MKNYLKKSFAAFTAATFLIACGPQKTEEVVEETVVETKTPTLTLLWETEASLPTNESVLFDAATGTIYVSNIGGMDPQAKDGKGSIAIIDKDGKIVNASWVTGLNSPKGMAISNGKLYVTDIDELVEIDIATAKVSNTWKVDGAEFLNDVAAHDGTVYFTDMNTGKVHSYADGAISTVSEGHASINGIAVAGDGTIYGLDGSGLKMWHSDGSSMVVNSNVTGGDGLVILGDGNFIASRWQGEIWFASADGQTMMLDTKTAESNTADIGYNAAEKIIYVPTFFKNKVAAYKLDY
ncbi:SMP-30/gluconolactonase/LRE family protein [Algoriphagus litoralis]|uniref:SMP-30/gluconolactonase/LRE family protein n=1 Tax=Algoriphagus litoralis TaxID=2202829 RepID=UPI000DB99394|nr:ATP-binding protein [Algoriphagus litoralis]